jgi:cystathionine gamma-synthase
MSKKKRNHEEGAPEHGFSTLSVHAGQDRQKPGDAITTPIFQTSTFVFQSLEEGEEFARLRSQGTVTRYEYGRYGSPTLTDAERKIAQLEGAESALLFASGMAAVSTSLLAVLSQGEHVVCGGEIYKKTRDFCETVLARFGVETTFVSAADVEAVRSALRPNTAVVMLECPTNPRLFVPDVPAVAEAVHKGSSAALFIDSTFATPVNLRPLSLGADLVIHSATKYLGGHNDILGGAIAGGKQLVSQVFDLQKSLGGVMDPHCAYLLIRGLKTLAVRVAKHNENGLAVARFLANHAKVKAVYYVGLEGHPSYKVARKLMSGYGGVVSFEVDGDKAAVGRFMDALTIPYLGPSLGGVETLAYHPATLTFNDLSPEQRAELGITDQLVRLACGIEDADDLVADLDQALAKV